MPTGAASTSTSVPPPQKAKAQNPPPLRQDATFQIFHEWRRCWDDYSVMVDLAMIPRQKPLIQLRMCLTLETQRVLEHTLNIPPNTDKTVEEVLDALQEHMKSLRNKAVRRREMLSCKQLESEPFSDFYIRLKHIPEELDVCLGGSSTCEETQLKMIILMGVRDEKLVEKLIDLESTASLQDVVNTCQSYEATRKATLSYVQSQITGSRSLLSTKDIRRILRTQMLSQLLPASVVQENTDLLKIAQQQRALAITVVIEVIGLGHRSALPKPSSADFVVVWDTTINAAKLRRKLLRRVVLPVIVLPKSLQPSLKPHRNPAVVVWDLQPLKHPNPSVSFSHMVT